MSLNVGTVYSIEKSNHQNKIFVNYHFKEFDAKPDGIIYCYIAKETRMFRTYQLCNLLSNSYLLKARVNLQ